MILIKQQYLMVFLCTVVFGWKVIGPFGGMFIDPYGFGGNIINPISTNQHLRLPFYGDVKDSLISKVKLIKETVFPTWGVIYIMMGIIMIVVA